MPMPTRAAGPHDAPARATAAVAAASALLCAASLLTGCAGEPAPLASTVAAAPLPSGATGVLTETDSRAVFDRAAAALVQQRTTAVNFVVERTDGRPLTQILNPTVRLDLRDPAGPVASLALSILAGNVAVGGQVYRQEADPGGGSPVWVKDPDPRTPLEFVLWKPGGSSRVAALGSEQVAGRVAHRYRAFDPTAYSGPTAGPLPSIAPTSSAPTPVPTSGTAGLSTPSATSASTTGMPAPAGSAAPAVGDYDEFWLADDGTLLRMVSVLGLLRLTSTKIEYGGDLRIDVPDTSKAITQQEFEARSTTTTPAP